MGSLKVEQGYWVGSSDDCVLYYWCPWALRYSCAITSHLERVQTQPQTLLQHIQGIFQGSQKEKFEMALIILNFWRIPVSSSQLNVTNAHHDEGFHWNGLHESKAYIFANVECIDRAACRGPFLYSLMLQIAKDHSNPSWAANTSPQSLPS